MPGGALSSSGSLGSRFPAFSGTTTPLRLPTSRLGSLRFSLASRYSGLTLSSLSTAAVGFGSPSRGVLYPGPPYPSLRERRLDLPSSLTSPLDACPALRPRLVPPSTAAGWGECCLPDQLSRRPLYNIIRFRGSITRPASLLLLASYSDYSYARRIHYRPASGL
jgi:hypothetical protein